MSSKDTVFCDSSVRASHAFFFFFFYSFMPQFNFSVLSTQYVTGPVLGQKRRNYKSIDWTGPKACFVNYLIKIQPHSLVRMSGRAEGSNSDKDHLAHKAKTYFLSANV